MSDLDEPLTASIEISAAALRSADYVEIIRREVEALVNDVMMVAESRREIWAMTEQP